MLQRACQRFIRVFFLLVLLAGLGWPGKAAANAETSKLFFPTMLIRHGNYRTELQLYNMGSMDAMVTIEVAGGASELVMLDRTIQAGSARLVTEDDFPTLAGGFNVYRVVVSASQPLDGVMAFYRKTISPGPVMPGLVSLFRGFTGAGSGGPGTYSLFFGPVYSNSGLTLMNTSASVATATIDLYNAEGILAKTILVNPIPALASAAVNLSTQSVPVGTYMAVVSSTQPLAGSVMNTEVLPWGGQQVRIRGPLQPGSPALLARALRAVSDTGGARTTRVFTANLAVSQGAFNRTLYNQSGGPAHDSSFNLPALGSRTDDLGSLDGLSDGSAYAVSMTGTDVAVSDLTEYTASPGNVSFASYATDTGFSLPLPRLVKDTGRGSVISIYNPNSSPANISIALELFGGVGHSITATVPAQGWARTDLRAFSSLPAGFTGGGMLTADQPVTALVDEFYTYVPPCTAPTVNISHTPVGALYPTSLVEFSAAAAGDEPLSYAWTRDGVAAGTDSAIYSTTLTEGGHTIGVTVTNACGTGSASELVSVSAPPCVAPTLSYGAVAGRGHYPHRYDPLHHGHRGHPALHLRLVGGRRARRDEQPDLRSKPAGGQPLCQRRGEQRLRRLQLYARLHRG